jgi:hypothetical protein
MDYESEVRGSDKALYEAILPHIASLPDFRTPGTQKQMKEERI